MGDHRHATPTVVDLEAIAARARGNGVHWTLLDPSDLNVNLVRLDPNQSIAEHVNHELDVVLVVLAGAGRVVIDGREHEVLAHSLVNVPAGAARTVWSDTDGMTYLTVHRRRGAITLERLR